MNRITVYTTEPCSFCVKAKSLLRAKGLEFEEINLGRDAEGRLELASRTGMMTFPQVLVNGELVGGFKEMQAATENGRLEELLAAAPGSFVELHAGADARGRARGGRWQ